MIKEYLRLLLQFYEIDSQYWRKFGLSTRPSEYPIIIKLFCRTDIFAHSIFEHFSLDSLFGLQKKIKQVNFLFFSLSFSFRFLQAEISSFLLFSLRNKNLMCEARLSAIEFKISNSACEHRMRFVRCFTLSIIV